MEFMIDVNHQSPLAYCSLIPPLLPPRQRRVNSVSPAEQTPLGSIPTHTQQKLFSRINRLSTLKSVSGSIICPGRNATREQYSSKRTGSANGKEQQEPDQVIISRLQAE